MDQPPYSVQQVADLLGLHVKTVRAYVREGRLKAVRIGKQYRIPREELDAFTGYPVAPPAAETAGRRRRAEASSVVRVEAIGREAMDRLSTMLMAATAGRTEDDERLRVETIYDEERAELKIILIGSPDDTAELLRLVAVMVKEKQ
ncbi:DNA-binding protein [Sphaerisporangium album]|uniref:DNA-binding protein n=1 Tax=Sphaerisporangium album TaxID=509200 RepID=A0A367FS96_9ACTN|nr:helix-turn-helix domain-containing protein [Sphaerisporangium album]RCG33268.1 DNA-binding protein [Sphaerisporangium album]